MARRSTSPRLLLGAATILLAGLLPAGPAAAAPDDPDPGFAGDGELTRANRIPGALVTLPDDRVLVAMTPTTDPAPVQVTRLRADGTPDSGFGSGGTVTLTPSAAYEDVALTRDAATGKVYVSAFMDDGTSTTRIWRLTARGGLDPTWGSGGVLTAPSTPVDALAVQSGTGRLVLAHGSEAFRLTPTGAFDTGFGVAGIASLPTTQIGQILPLPGGRIQLAGKSDTRLEVVRLRRNGTPDPGWSGDGRASYRPPVPADTTSYFVWPALTVILPTGEVIALAAVNQTTPASFDVPLTVVRFTSSGARDARFTPRHRIGFEAQNSRVALQVNGKILVVGRLAGSLDTGLLRLRPDGRADRGFGSRGVLSVPDNSVTFGDVALQRSGRILLSGTQGTTWPDYTAFVRAYRGDAVVKCQGRWPTQMGTAGADVLRGTGARDVISGLGGRDTLVGLGGGDLLCGQAGDDVLRGGAGADVLVGGPGRDTLDGGPGPDRLIQ